MPQDAKAASEPGKKPITAETFKTENPSAYKEIFDLGAKTERERIQGIESISAPEASELVSKYKYDASATKESVAILFAEKMSSVQSKSPEAKKDETPVSAIQDAARNLGKQAAAIPSGSSAVAGQGEAAEIQSMVAAMSSVAPQK